MVTSSLQTACSFFFIFLFGYPYFALMGVVNIKCLLKCLCQI